MTDEKNPPQIRDAISSTPYLAKRTIALIALTIMVGGLIVWSVIKIRASSQAELAFPTRGAIVEAIYGLGKVKTLRRFEVKTGILTTVEGLFVREGDTVKKGAPLIKFSDSTPFRAPFDGTVTLVLAQPGESVVPQVSVLRVDDLSQRYVEVSLEQQGALRVKKGQVADVIFESVRGEKLSGMVTALFSKNDEFLAHIAVEKLAANVLPGMTADVAITVGKRENALLVPLGAITGGLVVLKRDGKTIKSAVKVGAVNESMAEILEGDVRETDQVIMKSEKAAR